MRVRLITEGNYPTVVGGVTRWCDLLLRGLPEFDWCVLALGVQPTRAGRAPAPITYVPQAPLLTAQHGVTATVDRVRGLTRQLFAAVPDPDALQAALVECAAGPAPATGATSPSARAAIGEELDALLGPMSTPDGRRSVRGAVAMVEEVLGIAAVRAPLVDLNLAACAGRAVIPAAIDHALRATPVIVVEHGVYVHEANLRTAGGDVDPFSRALVRRSASNLAALGYAIARAVVGVSDANCRRSESFGADPRRTVTIANGVAVPAVAPPWQPSSLVGTVGRIDVFKGVDVFVRAAVDVAEHVSGARFLHVGPAEGAGPGGAYADACRSVIRRAALEDRFTFLGAHPDPTNLLADMGVFVLPSRSEGLPFALLEAMAAGLPVVATTVGGVPEALGSAGVLVSPEDPDELAAAIRALLLDPVRCRALGQHARRVVQERYTLERMLDGYREILWASRACREVVA